MNNKTSSQEKDELALESKVSRRKNIFKHFILSQQFILFFLLLLVIGISGYLLWILNESNISRNHATTTYIANNKNLIPQTPTYVPTPTHGAQKKLSVTSWEKFSDHYGEYSVVYPDSWNISNPSYVVDCTQTDIINLNRNCASFDPVPAGSNIFPTTAIISIIVQIQKNRVIKKYNFTIPAISQTANAFEFKSASIDTIDFPYNGVWYEIKANLDTARKEGYSTENIPSILEKMASSMTFLNETSSCSVPTLSPLKSFPQSFTLSNYHLSDGSDAVNGCYPKTLSGQPSYCYDNHYPNMPLNFMVNYIKAGDEFQTTPSFLQTVSMINPTTADHVGTDLWHLNCVNTQEDTYGSEQPYSVSTSSNDPFGVNLYGSANNTRDLWDVPQWNIALLQKTRNTVYVRMGDAWQKYTSTGYFAEEQTQVGGKPAIYLYPQKTQNIQVTIHTKGTLTQTDPLYNAGENGWNVTVSPNGTINNKYDSLYYEALVYAKQPTKGYVIPYNELFSFTKNYVQKLGLNDKEASAFVDFWQTRLRKSPYYFVSPLNSTAVSEIYPLTISPKPDTLIRIELYLRPLSKKISVSAPTDPIAPARKGFTAVEWGGIYENNFE